MANIPSSGVDSMAFKQGRRRVETKNYPKWHLNVVKGRNKTA